jgi:hypothetical protein
MEDKAKLAYTLVWNFSGAAIGVATLLGVSLELNNQTILMMVCLTTGSILAVMK